MGTNYYHEDKLPCESCGRHFERKHIGKSSAGWCFSLHVHPEQGINDLADWEARWKVGQIVDEYDNVIAPEVMLQKITNRGRGEPYPAMDAGWYRDNHAEPGPNGLARATIGRSCSGHGAGTWDLIKGDFS